MVDMRRVFDGINRSFLWHKLAKLGIKGKMLQISRSMYESVRCKIKHCDKFTDFLDIKIGLKQGCVCSPIYYAMFVEDLELYLQNSTTSGLSIDDVTLMLLMYADDMAILAETPEDLQASLNSLHEYCCKWDLQVNTDKTKVMVFRKRGQLHSNEKWYYNGQLLETVNDFNYLGVVLNYTGSFNLNQSMLIGKGLKALNVLLYNLQKFNLKPKICCQLFDAFVASILNYSCVVWGAVKSKDIERVHLKFCKRILNVKLSASNAAVYGELGRYPLYINRYCQIVKYWTKVTTTENCILSSAYSCALSDCNNGKRNWASSVKNILCSNGFGDVWEQPSLALSKSFIPLFKQRLVDMYTQDWNGSVQTSSVLSLYSYCKDTFAYEQYLDKVKNKVARSLLTKLRISAHRLRLETGRYGRSRIDRSERTCTVCSNQANEIEDEYHFVLVCERYKDLRNKYIQTYYRQHPSMAKLVALLSSEDTYTLINLGKFVTEAFKIRNSVTNVQTS